MEVHKGQIVQFYIGGRLTTGIVKSDKRVLDYIIVTSLPVSGVNDVKPKRYLLLESEIEGGKNEEPCAPFKDVKTTKKRGRPRKARRLG